MGKKDGPCAGRGGSQHLCYKNFHTNGVQGGIVPNAVGAGLSKKLNAEDGIAVVFLGDGTLGQGIVYESFNFASLWSIPVLFIIQNNRYAMSTKVENAVSGSIIDRPKSFGIESDEIESNDLVELYSSFEKAFNYVRKNKKPFCQVIHTYRLGPHSKGDDYRDQAEIKYWKRFDPVILLEKYMHKDTLEEMNDEVKKEIKMALEIAERSEKETFDPSDIDLPGKVSPSKINNEEMFNRKKVRGVEILNSSLEKILKKNKDVIILGEDICDPYGGAFKVTKNLSTKYPNRLFNTPISEAGIVGVGTGMAMKGKRPIVEIMFGDFITLCADQLINHSSKYSWMYNNKVNVPLVVRTPMGGRRGYGPTHSQTLEKIFLGIPGLTVVAQSNIHNSGELLYRTTLLNDGPVLFVENKSLYSEYVLTVENNMSSDFYLEISDTLFPTIKMTLDKDSKPDATIITYGGNVNIAVEAAKKLLIEHEILVNIVVVSVLSPVPVNEITSFVKDSKYVCTLEEGNIRMGWGAEIVSQLVKELSNKSYHRFASEDCPVPSNKQLESKVLINIDKVVDEIRKFYI
ncbi:hypothetical protein JMF89_16515, partial [Clostridiaceae bacterium UIB06]|nr:hypothetical protein [Clostridiaceae bacterium UIB06]